MTEPQRRLEPEPFAGAAKHLAFELRRLELRLGRQVLRLRAAQRLADDPFRGLYISDAQVDALLRSGGEPLPDWAGEGAEELTRSLAELDGERTRRLEASRRAGITLPLIGLARLFDLDAFEQEVVLIALAPELDRRFETLFAYVQNDVTRKRPTAGMALDLLCDGLDERAAMRAALTSEGRLLRHRLLRLVDDPQEREPALPTRYLRLEDRVAGFLLGSEALDGSLLGVAERIEPQAGGGPTDLPLEPELRARLTRAAGLIASGGVALLHGPAGAGKRRAATALARELGRPLLAADLGVIVRAGPGLGAALPLLRREALLAGAVLLLEHFEVLLADEREQAALTAELGRELPRPAFPVLLAGEAPWEPAGFWEESPFLSFALSSPSLSRRLELWHRAVAERGTAAMAEDELAEIAGKFALTPGQIRAAGRRAADLAAVRGDATPTADDLHAAARGQSSHGLSRLARKVETSYGWDDIVLPRRSLQQLREIDASVRHRGRVYGDWGFEAKLSLGKGLNALFSGPSGTGKTMAASILARALRLDLYTIDLASVVSKYIGETEKNLSRIFDEAQTSNAVLFFDEADALFGKRSEVKDSHDRYANIEIAYLLQRMEEYEGISILATNLRNNLDDAFARRLHHAVEFPLPDAAHRERIWRLIFPEAAPLADDVDLPFLARQFELAGGSIKNVALAAAFLAADEEQAITMRHLVLATARELGKLGKLPTKSDFGQYYELIRERGK